MGTLLLSALLALGLSVLVGLLGLIKKFYGWWMHTRWGHTRVEDWEWEKM